MASWDVFHADRLEIERSLSTAEVRAALARGDLRDDDLIRPAGGTIPWARLADLPALIEPAPGSAPSPDEADALAPPLFPEDTEDDEGLETLETILVEEDVEDEGKGKVDGAAAIGREPAFGRDDLNLAPDDHESLVALPIGDEGEEFDPQEEDEEAAEFTLSRNAPERVEELDLAAMVDVAFQLVLFFLVTATTVLYKSLEVPKPNPESNAAAAAPGKPRSLDDIMNDYILVEIDPAGAMRIDREPVAAALPALVERLRAARERTGRHTMLLSADFTTPHRHAVLAYDAANEIGLGIAIARPAAAAAKK